MSEKQKIKLEVGKSYVTNSGVTLKPVLEIIHDYNPKYYVMALGNIILTCLYKEDGKNAMNDREFIVGEYVEKPVWDWGNCKFAKYIFRNSGKYWFYSFQKPKFHNELKSWITTAAFEYGRIPDEFAPVFSGKDEDSLIERPDNEL